MRRAAHVPAENADQIAGAAKAVGGGYSIQGLAGFTEIGTGALMRSFWSNVTKVMSRCSRRQRFR